MKKTILFHIPKQVSHTITLLVSTKSNSNHSPNKQHVRMPKTSISDDSSQFKFKMTGPLSSSTCLLPPVHAGVSKVIQLGRAICFNACKMLNSSVTQPVS